MEIIQNMVYTLYTPSNQKTEPIQRFYVLRLNESDRRAPGLMRERQLRRFATPARDENRDAGDRTDARQPSRSDRVYLARRVFECPRARLFRRPYGTRANAHTHTQTHTHTHKQTQTHTHNNTQAHIITHTHTLTKTHTHNHNTHTHTHTCTHKRKHTYQHTQSHT